MSDIPSELRYSPTHEWVKLEDDGTALVGITDHAQAALGDLVFVELPEIGDEFTAQDECAVVESVKAASDMYCPIDGEVLEVNDNLNDAPELVNQSPYEDGWLMRLQPSDPSQIDELLDAAGYAGELND